MAKEIPQIYSFTPDTWVKPKRRISIGWSVGLSIVLSLILTFAVSSIGSW